MPEGVVGDIYVIHFREPFKHAKHYRGWSVDVARRIAQHRSGGSHSGNLMRHVKAAGIEWVVARVIKNVDRFDERDMKNNGSAVRDCPICRGELTYEECEFMEPYNLGLKVA